MKNFKYFISILLFVSLISVFFTLFYSTDDTLISDHPLIDEVVLTPDYVFVIGAKTEEQNSNKDIKGGLTTFDSRSPITGYPSNGIFTKDILLPETPLKVLEVYRAYQSPLASPFAPETYYAIVTNKENLYKIQVSFNNLYFGANNCSTRHCKNWKRPLHEALNESKELFKIFLEYIPHEDEEHIQDSQATLISYLEKEKITILEVEDHHPHIKLEVTPLQYVDLFFQHEKLRIKFTGSLLN